MQNWAGGQMSSINSPDNLLYPFSEIELSKTWDPNASKNSVSVYSLWSKTILLTSLSIIAALIFISSRFWSVNGAMLAGCFYGTFARSAGFCRGSTPWCVGVVDVAKGGRWYGVVFARCSRFGSCCAHWPRVGRIGRDLGEGSKGGKQEENENCDVFHDGENV